MEKAQRIESTSVAENWYYLAGAQPLFTEDTTWNS